MLSEATSARVAQADQKGWKEFHKEVNASIQSLVSPKPEKSKSAQRNEAGMKAFFSQLKNAKGTQQSKSEGRL